MPALYVMIPIAVIVVALCIWLFFWSVNTGQYDDLDSPAHRILFDDEDPAHKAGISQANPQNTSSTPQDKGSTGV